MCDKAVASNYRQFIIKMDKLREQQCSIFACQQQNNDDLPEQPIELALLRQQPAFTSTCLVFNNHQTFFLAAWKGPMKHYVDPLETETCH